MHGVFRYVRSHLSGSGFLASSSIIFAGSLVVNVFNYIFTLLMSRLLNVEAFGEVSALLSLLLIISVPASAVSMLMTREGAARSHDGHAIVRDLFLFLRKHTLMASLVLWGIFLLCTPLLARFLHIPIFPFLIFSALIPLSATSSLQSGTLQGLQEFWMLSKQNIISAGVKLVVSIALVLAGFSVIGVMFSLVLAQAVAWFYGRTATRSKLFLDEAAETEGTEYDAKTLSKLFGTLFIATLLITLLSNVDVLLAKHYLPPALAGQYGALSTIGKIIVYGIGAVTTVLLPMVASAHARGSGEARRVLGLSLAAIAAASAVVFVLFAFFPSFFVSALFGAKYLMISPDLGIMACAMGFVGIATALINYFIAIRNASFMYWLALSIAIETVLIARYHTSLASIATMLALSAVILCVFMGINYRMVVNQKRYS